MRSVKTIKAGSQSLEDYYTKDESLRKDEYYSEEEMESAEHKVTTAQWMGGKSTKLGYKGDVDQQMFKEWFYGNVPFTGQRIRGKARSGQENLAVDVTLSAPKSFSMYALQDLGLYEDHMEACRRTVTEMERRYCLQRKYIDGKQVNIAGDGFVAAAIPHWTSREMDMMLHSHILIFNGIQGPDGKWRAFDDRQMSRAEWVGSFYRNELAKLTQQRGYQIREVALERGGHSFEIEGITREQIEHFSKRSLQIVAAAEKKGVDRNDVVLTTRKAKKVSKTWAEFRDSGLQAMTAIGVELQRSPSSPIAEPIGQKNAVTVVESAIRHLSTRSVHFTREDLYKYALDHMQQYELSEVDQVVAAHPELVDYGEIRGIDTLKGHYTTAGALEREIRTVNAWREGQGKATAILDRDAATVALSQLEAERIQEGKAPLRSGQREAILGTLTSQNRHQIIHGLSGAGKTTALRLLKTIAEAQGLEVLGFAPSIKAAKRLSDELGIQTNTLQKLVKSSTIELKPNQLIFIDEGGMASAEMLDVVMPKINAAGARVVPVGDTGQNPSIEAGSPMRSLMMNGAEVHHLAEIIRQQDSFQKRAVELISQGRGLDALALLSEHQYVNEIQERSERVRSIAMDYLSLSAAEQAKTLIVAGTNAEKDAIALEIRQGQKLNGVLGKSVQVSRLQGRGLKRKEAKAIATYTVGDVLSFVRPHAERSEANERYTVMEKAGEVLVLSNEAGQFYRFNPAQGILDNSVTITQLKDRGLTPEQAKDVLNYEIGDYLSLNLAYKTTALQKDTLYQVVAKEKGELIVTSAGGRLYRFEPKKFTEKQVFSSQSFDVAVGDQLKWTKNNPTKGEVNGETFKIAAIEGGLATALTESGKTIEVNLSQPLAVDYTLVNTSYQVQGLDGFRVFVSATNDPTSNREPFYVSISRQLKSLKIWVQDLEGLKRRVVESNVQQNPLELLFGESNGSSPIREHDAAAQRGIEPDAGATGAEPPAADPAQQQYEHHPNPHPRRDGLIPDGVRTATGEPEAVGGSGRNSGTDRNLEGAEGPTDELGADPRGHDLSGELRDGGDSELRDAVTQQRLDASAANLKSCMERVISSLSVLGNDELVHDSAIVESTREVVEALEPIVSSLEGQPVAVPPKRDLTSAMARVINGLTAMDSEDVFGESEIIAEIKSLVERVEAHTIAQEQLTQHTNSGDHHVGQNSSRESTRPTVRRDSGVDTHARIARTESDRAASSTKRHSADLEPAARGSARAAVPDRDAGAERHDPELTGHHRRADQSAAQTSRGQERDLPAHEAEFSHLAATAQHRRVEHRDVETESASSRNDRRSPAGADQGNGPEQAGTIATRLFNRATDGISARADAIVRIRLERELAEPLAQLRATLARIREVNQLNERLKAEFDARQSSIDAHQAELAAEGKSITAQKERLFAQMEVQLAQSKVEVLDTTLTEWRSLRQEPELHQIPELAVAPSDRAELTNLIANYPAQKVIDYAMAEYAQVRQHFELGAIGDAKHQSPASATKMPTPRTNSPPKPQQSTAAPGCAASPPKPKPRPQRPLTPRPVKPVPIVAFWQPDYVEAQRPDTLEPKHWEEFKRSAIHPDLVQLNVSSLDGQPVLERLLDEKLGSLSGDANQYATEEVKRIVKPYERVAEGGWWGTAGVDAKSLIDLQPGQRPQQSLWGVFKPDKPILEVRKPLIRHRYGEVDKAEKIQRQNTESLSIALLMAVGINANKFIEYRPRKYENPAGTERHLYLPNVPDEIAQRIYDKNDIEPTEAERQSGFWSVVASHPEIPIVVTEGLKKTLSSTSQGEVTIGLAGVNALYRARDEDKEKLPERVLSDEMVVFATPGRSFTFAFDSDTKISTIFNVRAELIRGVELLEAKGSTVKVAKWKAELGKGLDDVIANQGPTVYAVALSKAEAAEREKRIYYRTQYNALAKEIHRTKPHLSGEALDIEVYLLAVAKGEPKDGERFLSQSDHARSLKDPAQVAAYIEHIKASIPQYLQQQQAQEQERKDRARYEELAQSITAEMGALKPGPLDIEVCIRLKLDNPNLERILAQSDWAKSRETPEEKAQYIQSVQSAAALTLQQRAEAQTRAEQEALAAQAQQQRELEAAKRAAQLQAQQQKELAAAQAKQESELAAAQAAAQAKAQIQAQQPAESRAQYEAIAQQVRNQLYEIQPNQFDSVVYKWAQAKGLDGDLVLAQSDQAQTLKHPAQVNGYLRQVRKLANRLDLEPGPEVSAQQRQLNARAVMSCDWLAKNYGKNQEDGWRVFEGKQFSYYAKDGEYKIYSHAKRRVVLERGNNRLVGTLSRQEVEKLENAVVEGKVMKAEERKAEMKVEEIKKNRKHGR